MSALGVRSKTREGVPGYTAKRSHALAILILELVLTVAIAATTVFVIVSGVTDDARRYTREAESDYQSLEEGYVSVFKALVVQVDDEIADGPSFDEMQTWLQAHDTAFADAVGADIYDGFAMTYKGRYAHSWNYGDYSDYEPDTRLWYQEALKADGDVAVVAPYVTYLGPTYPDSDKYIEMSIVQRYSDDISFDLDLKVKDVDALLRGEVAPYAGTEALLFDKNGYILSATDSSLYCHNVNVPDDALSSGFSELLISLGDAPDALQLANVDGTLETVYALQDDAGNTYCVMFPVWSLVQRYFLAVGLIAMFLIFLEVAIYVRNRRVLEEMSSRDRRISEIARVAFQRQLYVDLDTMRCSHGDQGFGAFETQDYRELFECVQRSVSEEAQRREFGALVSPEALAAFPDADMKTGRFSVDVKAEDDTMARKVYELSCFVSRAARKRVAVILVNDITDRERELQKTMQSIAHRYSAVFVGNLTTLKVDTVKIDRYYESVSAPDQSFQELQEVYAKTYIQKAYVEAFIDAVSFAKIANGLEESQGYSITVLFEDGHWYTTRVIRSEDYASTHRFVIFVENTDDQMAHQAELQKALDDATEASKAKSDFLSRMSHDIRTPMNGIIGMTGIAMGYDNPPRTQDCLKKIDTSSRFLLGLVNDILDISKAESGAVTLHPEPYRPGEFREYLDAVIRPLCDQKGITFHVVLDTAEGNVPTLDELRANQIVFNLLSNAVKFTHEGGSVLFELHEKLVDATHMDLHVTVSDTGIGISKDFLEHLFEPFAQEGDHVSATTQGTGLGLTIVKRMVDLMGGTIEVTSEPGKGTTFELQGVVGCVPANRDTKEVSSASSDDLTMLRGKRVLLVEDHPLNTEIAVAILQDKGVLVTAAEDGKRGFDAFAASPDGYYDAILMDLRMPVMDGYEATRRIRSLERGDATTVPIIAMTADAYTDDIQNTRAAGMDDHLAKPFDPDQLYRILMRHLAR